MTFLVEPQAAGDAPAVETLLDLAFGLSRRAKTSYRLRELSEAAHGLSFVVRDGEFGLSGALSFWPLKVGAAGADGLLLGPLAVHPQRQTLGIGLALMTAGIAAARAQGHRLMILVGDAPYYARVGFAQVPEGRLIMPGPVDPKRLLMLELAPGAFTGVEGLVLSPARFSGLHDTTWRRSPGA
jgi:predicted N-acetyltransferase YhbS